MLPPQSATPLLTLPFHRLLRANLCLLAWLAMVLPAISQTVSAWGGPGAVQTVPGDLSDTIAVAAGAGHALALQENGTVKAWGNNASGQSTVPSGLADVVEIAAGGGHSLALRNDGSLAAWGSDSVGESTVPVGLTNVMAIACGYFHSVALKQDGTVVAWGANDNSQRTVPVNLSGVVAIAAGGSHSLALRSNGTVVAWGYNYSGQLTVPQTLSDVVAIAAGGAHSLALRSNGTVVAWGYNDHGQSTVPAGLTGVVALAAGGSHSMALKGDGTAVSWGNSYLSQSTLPQGLSAVTGVAAGGNFSLALAGNVSGVPQIISPRKAVATGGYGSFYYQIRTASPATSFTASGLPSGLVFDAGTGVISGTPTVSGNYVVTLGATNGVGSDNISLTLSLTGASVFVGTTLPAVWSVGINPPGEFAITNQPLITASGLPPGTSVDSTDGTISGSPQLVGSYSVEVHAESIFGSLQTTQTFEVSPIVTWGNNDYGQTTLPLGLTSARAVAAGNGHSLALRNDGTVAAWGFNFYNQSTVPVGLANVIALAAGDYHSLALRQDGTVVAWGNNQVGQCSVPPGLNGVMALAGGGRHSLALLDDGLVVAWGDPMQGQTTVPAGLSGVVAIAAGKEHSVALRSDGVVVAWGDNTYGQQSVPSGLSNVVAISAGEKHSVALKGDGTVVVWGDDIAASPGLTGVVAIASGKQSLALKGDGSVILLGSGSTVPQGLNHATSIAVGGGHFLAINGSNSGLPSIVSPVRALAAGGTGNFLYRILALNGATNFTASGLPAGLVVDAATGIISGTPIVSGVFSVVMGATNGNGSTSATLTLYVTGAPVFKSNTLPSLWLIGQRPTGQVIATALPTITATGLPLGTTLDPMQGTISGTPLQPGQYNVLFRFENGIGFVERSFAIEVSPVTAWGSNPALPLGLNDIIGLAAGGSHSLALRQDGTVVAWGSNASNQSTVPVGLSNVMAVAAGEAHSLALKNDGLVVGWGSNTFQQSTVPAFLSGVVAIAAGTYHSLALRSNGTVVAWGDFGYGQSSVPIGLTGVVGIAAGGTFSLALLSDGTVVAWGYLGAGATPIPVGLTNVVAIAAGKSHALALRQDGSVVAWGQQTFGKSTVPAGLADVIGIAAGTDHSVALKRDGALVSWGSNSLGQGTVPPGLTDMAAIAAANNYSLALVGKPNVQPIIISPAQAVTTGGYGSFYYQIRTTSAANNFLAAGLPMGLTLNATTGVISGTPTEAGQFAVQLTATNASGSSTKTLTLHVPGAPVYSNSTVPPVWSLGLHPVGAVFAGGQTPMTITATGLPPGVSLDPVQGTMVGLPTRLGHYPVVFRFTNSFGFTETSLTFEVGPITAWGENSFGQTMLPSGLRDAMAISAGEQYSLFLKRDGTVQGWGEDSYGQSTVPTNLTNVIAISAGYIHSLALRANGTVVAWGYDENGQSTVPSGLDGVTAIAAGAVHSLALRNDGTVAAWGDNEYNQRTVPSGLNDVIGIAAGAWHSLALRSDGTVVAWGNNDYQQSTVPSGLTGVVAVSAGFDYSLALRSNGTVVAWGSNDAGQSTVPSGLSGVIAISAGNYHALALKGDGTVVAWGFQAYGQSTVPSGLGSVQAISAGGYHSLALVVPTIVGPAQAYLFVGTSTLLAFDCSWSGGNYAATGLPSGLTMNAATGEISGTPQAAAFANVDVTYTQTGGGHTYTAHRMLSMNILQATDYATWRQTNLPGNGPQTLGSADPDHDGFPNLLEYARGTNPLSQDAGAPTTVQLSASGHLQLETAVLDGLAATFVLRAQFANDTNFTNGLSEVTTPSMSPADFGRTLWRFTDPNPMTGQLRRFGRLVITTPP